MSYEKQNWATGDIITADKLNHMEDGIFAAASSGATGLITSSDDFETIDQSYNDIVAMAEAGLIPHYSVNEVMLYLVSTSVFDQTGEGDLVYVAEFKGLVDEESTLFHALGPSVPMYDADPEEQQDETNG